MIALEPVVILIAPEVEHVPKFGPATEVGDVKIVRVFVEVALLPQNELLAVNVNVTTPAALSAALGV